MYSYPYSKNPYSQKPFNPGRSIAKKIMFLVVGFDLLLFGTLFYFLGLPAWQTRLSGVQTHAVAHEMALCDSGDEDSSDTYAFSYRFTDGQGEVHNVAEDSFCTNVYNNGDTITIWYMPNNPNHILTDAEAMMLYIFSALGAMAIIIPLFILLSMIFAPLLRGRSQNAGWPYNGMGMNG